MTSTSNQDSYHIARRVGEEGARPPVGNWAGIEKNTTSCKNLLKSKTCQLVSTFNARTLNSPLKLGEITALSEKLGLEAVCIQEHRIHHEDINIRYHNMGKGWIMATSSAEKGENNSTIRGIGLLLSPRAYKALQNIESITPRILIATFSGNPETTIITCYSPTNCSDEEVTSNFYGELTSLTKAIPRHNFIIIGGDMNAQIGQHDANGSTYHEQTNRNGRYLTDYISECELINTSTQYTKRNGKLWTIQYANGAKAQIDHILVNRKWKNSALNCEAYNSFASIESDHRVVTAKIRLSLRANKISSKKRVLYELE